MGYNVNQIFAKQDKCFAEFVVFGIMKLNKKKVIDDLAIHDPGNNMVAVFQFFQYRTPLSS